MVAAAVGADRKGRTDTVRFSGAGPLAQPGALTRKVWRVLDQWRSADIIYCFGEWATDGLTEPSRRFVSFPFGGASASRRSAI